MKNSKVLMLVFLMYLLLNTGINLRSEEKYKMNNVTIDKISTREIETYKEYYNTFIIRFSNLIFETDGKHIKIPVFEGSHGDVLYSDLIKYCVEKKMLEPDVEISGFIVKTKKRELKLTFHELLVFYKSNILKNVNVEDISSASLSETDWTIKYDFIIEGIPCYLKIEIEAGEEDGKDSIKYTSIYQIKPNEKMNKPCFVYDFYIGMKSTDRFDVNGNKIN